MAALAACLAVAAGAPVAWFMAEPAKAIVASAATEARDLADMLGKRSPGARTQAELTKHARVAAKVRIEPKLASAPPPGVGPSTPALVDLLQPPVTPVGVVAEGSAPPLTPPPALNTILTSVPGDQTVAPPGDGGGPVHFPTSEPREDIPPTAVPEPGTWALMLMGFGLIGWRVRQGRRKSTTKIATRVAN